MIRPKIIRPKVIKPTKLKKIIRPNLPKNYKTEFSSKDYKTEFDKASFKTKIRPKLVDLSQKITTPNFIFAYVRCLKHLTCAIIKLGLVIFWLRSTNVGLIFVLQHALSNSVL